MSAVPSNPFWRSWPAFPCRPVVLVLLVLAVQCLFRRQLTPRWRCALWAVVLVRCSSPFAPGKRGERV
jgi:beta-lactamase regulating signal transducer with metallopeptidase domain